MLAIARQYGAQGVGMQMQDPMATEDALLSSSNANSVIDGDGIPRRVPQLAVRNKTADNWSSNDGAATATTDARSENGSSGSPSSRSSQRPRTPLSSRSASDDAVTTRRWYGSESGCKSKSIGQPAKKKKGGMLGFLMLKEPSTSAWAQFAEAEKEKAKQKGVDTVASGLSGVSSQKLPEFVPKVNSKWDGLPESARKSSESKTTSRTNRNSGFSTSTRQSTWTAMTSSSGGSQEARQPFGFMSSPLQSPRLPRTSSQSNTLGASEDRKSTSSGSTRQPPALAIDTASQTQVVEETDENKPQTFLFPPSPTDQEKIVLPTLNAPITPPELEGTEIPQSQELDSRTDANTQDSALPLIPPAEQNTVVPVLVGIHYPELDSNAVERTSEESRTSNRTPEPERDVPSPILSSPPPRRAINFSRPRGEKPVPPRLHNLPSSNIAEAVRSSRAEDGVALSPASKSNTGRVEQFLTGKLASPSREMGQILKRMGSPLVAESRQPEAAAAEGYFNPVYATTPTGEEAEPETISTFYDDDQERPSTAGSVATAQYSPETSAVRSNSITSLAPSYAGSAMSESWRMTPKERLGLGSKVRRSEVVPWEVTEELAAMRAANGPTSPIPEGMRKRLSIRLNSKR